MATYASLTQEQKDAIKDYLALLRPWGGEQARANNHAGAIDDQWNANVSVIVNSLDALEVIPNESGLSGAAPLTKEEVVTQTSHAQNILTNMSSHTGGFNTDALRQTWAKAAGGANTIG